MDPVTLALAKRHANSVGVPLVTRLPVDRHKFDSGRVTLHRFTDTAPLEAATNVVTDAEETWDGQPTVKLTSVSGVTADAQIDIPTADLSGATFIELRYKPSNVAGYNVLGFEVRAPDAPNQWKAYPTPPVKAVTDEGWRVLRVPLARFTPTGAPDWGSVTRLRVYLQSAGGQTATMHLAHVSAGTTPASVQMHFDDGYLNQYQHGFDVTQKHHLRGTLGVITSWPGANAGAMTWQQVRDMAAAGWAVVSHTHNHLPLADQDEEGVRYEIATAQRILRDQGFDLGAHALIAPFGSWNPSVGSIAAEYLKFARTGGLNPTWHHEFPQSHPLLQNYLSPKNTDTPAAVMGWIDEAIANGEELVLAWHQIVDGAAADQYEYPKADFETVCAYLRAKLDEGACISPTMFDVMPQTRTATSVDADGDLFMTTLEGRPALLDLG